MLSNSVGGRRHSWLSGLPGGGAPGGSVEAAPGILLSWKMAAAGTVLSGLTAHALSLRCKYSARPHTQTPGPRGTAAPAPRWGCSECP